MKENRLVKEFLLEGPGVLDDPGDPGEPGAMVSSPSVLARRRIGASLRAAGRFCTLGTVWGMGIVSFFGHISCKIYNYLQCKFSRTSGISVNGKKMDGSGPIVT